MRFVIYEDEAGEWRWRLKASNGRIVADSAEGYARKRNAMRAASLLWDSIQVTAWTDAFRDVR